MVSKHGSLGGGGYIEHIEREWYRSLMGMGFPCNPMQRKQMQKKKKVTTKQTDKQIDTEEMNRWTRPNENRWTEKKEK